MSSIVIDRSQTPAEQIDRCLDELTAGKIRLSSLSLPERAALIEDCLVRVVQTAPQWVDAACAAKGIAVGSTLRAEEVAAGPLATARHLRLLAENYQSIQRIGRISLPEPIADGPQGPLQVQVMPVAGLYDSVVFAGFKARSWLAPEVTRHDLAHLGRNLLNPEPAKCVLVLGAGNVSSIPATDTISKVFQEGKVVLLKMNPVNEYLGPVFEQLFAHLIDAGFLRIIYGGADVGALAIDHPSVDEVHITGSIHSHDAIVWGSSEAERNRRQGEQNPRLAKPITSELGNVSPWIMVPGRYTAAQLRFQAENVAASITNNASFNCVATKVIITWKHWPEREEFLNLVKVVLAQVPPRRAYYPGARERFCRFTGSQPDGGMRETLPWTLLRNADPASAPQLFGEESFVCVCAEIGLGAATEEAFFSQAVEFANERLWGTLSAAMTLPPGFRKQPHGEACFRSAIGALRYGAIGVNHWPGLIYAMMSPPWGGFPVGTLADAQSGLGTVHNTYMLEHAQKTVLEGPLTMWPKPFWFPTHRRPEPIAWRVLDLYARPSIWKLPGLLADALRA